MKLFERYHPERITCVDLAQSGSRSTAVELIGLVSSRAITTVTNIHSLTSFFNFCEAGALRRRQFNHEHSSQIASRVAVVRHVAAAT